MTETADSPQIHVPNKERIKGKSVCPIILGTSRYAASDQRDPNTGYFLPLPDRFDSDVETLRRAIDLGYNVIDTAAAYGDAERVIGETLKHRDRNSLVVITKIGIMPATRDKIRRSISASVQRLGTPPDILMIHNRWEGLMDTEMDDCITELDAAQESGMTRAIGISNFRPEELTHAIKAAKHPIAAYEAKINLINPRKDVLDLFKICRQHGIKFFASSALDRGNVMHQNNEIVSQIAEKYGMTVPQLGIFSVLKFGALPIVQSHSLDHLKENIETLKFGMSQGDGAQLSKLIQGNIS